MNKSLIFPILFCQMIVCSTNIQNNSNTQMQPDALIDSLLKAYSDKNIYLFSSLFSPDSSYRYYVSPAFYPSYTSRPYSSPPELIDSFFKYVPANSYYYWGFNEEILCHKSMFNESDSIVISQRPIIDTNYYYHISKSGDTLGVEVLLTGGQIDVYTSMPDCYPISIEKQVFYLIKTKNSDWKINKWFDFGTAD